MKAWFLGLTQRERVMVQYAGAVVAILILYSFILDPIMTSYDKNKKNFAASVKTLEWMRSAAVEVKQLSIGGSLSSRPQGKKLTLSVVDRSVQKAGLAGVMKRVQPEGDSGVRVWFENAPFDILIKWLATIESKNGLSVTEINVEQSEQTGLVNVRVFLGS